MSDAGVSANPEGDDYVTTTLRPSTGDRVPAYRDYSYQEVRLTGSTVNRKYSELQRPLICRYPA